jgi:hypothetical protein
MQKKKKRVPDSGYPYPTRDFWVLTGISDSISYPYPRFNIWIIHESVPTNKIPVSVSEITSRFGTRIRYPFQLTVGVKTGRVPETSTGYGY